MQKNSRIAIVTDSTCDIPRDMVKKLGIHLIPLYINWGIEVYRDLVEMDATTFYNRLMTDSVNPSTSCVTPQDFTEHLSGIKDAGFDEIVLITIGDRYSATHQMAVKVVDEIGIPVHLVDSRSVSIGLGAQVITAARRRNEGASISEILETIDRVRQQTRVYFTVDTLEYLHRGGRIGAAAAFVGTALKLKPSLYLDHEEGQIKPGQKIRTRKKAMKTLVDSFLKEFQPSDRLHIMIAHAVCPDDAEELIEDLKKRIIPVEIILTHVSSVVGVHAGPGAVGIGGFID